MMRAQFERAHVCWGPGRDKRAERYSKVLK